jgi:hypothetical protein
MYYDQLSQAAQIPFLVSSLGPSDIDVREMRVLRTFVVSNAIEERSSRDAGEEVRLVSDG